MDLFPLTRQHIQAHLAVLHLASLVNVCSSQHLPPTAPPMLSSNPFVAIWNAPTEVCHINNVPLDMSAYSAVTTPDKEPGQALTLFYTDRLGECPYIDEDTLKEYFGGIPQNGNLTSHLAKATNDIAFDMPFIDSPGLAVIDWEKWRPIWSRNWGKKSIYKTRSISKIRKSDPSLFVQQTQSLAKSQFETAAKNYMADTLALGKNERPQQMWGFYLFPDCYNYDYTNTGHVYTGKCPPLAKTRNDQLKWLWEASTALYPSVYLSTFLKNSDKTALFVRNQVYEAMRVAALPKRLFVPPVYVYNRPVFTDATDQFLNEKDLVSSIGECAALGAAGAVIWGASADYSNKELCQALSKYLTATLNPYIANVTAAAKLCSDILCQSNGRCVRKNYNSSDYLHLNPANFKIQKRQNEKYVALGIVTSAEMNALASKFTCQCYTGKKCQAQLPTDISNTPQIIQI